MLVKAMVSLKYCYSCGKTSDFGSAESDAIRNTVFKQVFLRSSAEP